MSLWTISHFHFPPSLRPSKRDPALFPFLFRRRCQRFAPLMVSNHTLSGYREDLPNPPLPCTSQAMAVSMTPSQPLSPHGLKTSWCATARCPIFFRFLAAIDAHVFFFPLCQSHHPFWLGSSGSVGQRF